MDALSKQKRSKRVRFSFRTMLIFVTLFCVYFGCWPATKSQGSKDVAAYVWGPNSGLSVDPIAPFLLKNEVLEIHPKPNGLQKIAFESTYYLWCLGFVAEVPFTTTKFKDIQ